MAENTRNSVMAVMAESTEGTPVIPSGATDFIALQDGFSFEPNFNSLENAEIRSSIGKAKSITGLEAPSASFSHYVRHSGVEGTAPGYSPLLKAVFGSQTANGTQRTTTTGSTTSVVSLGAGGSDFARGYAILVKDGTNGYSIRPVHSVSSNDLTLGFNLANAPATGIGVGKCVNFSPANSAHQSVTLWEYRGNAGAVEAIAGAKVTEFSMDVQAGELINGSYTLEGTKYYFNPINITSSTRYLDFTDDDGTFAASVTAKVYRDPHELATAITDAMNTANSGETHTCTYSDSTGKFTILCTGTLLSLLWNTGANTANTIGTKIGFSVAADDTGTAATTGYTSDDAQSWAAPYTPSYDSADPLVAKNNEVLLGDASDSTSFSAQSLSFRLGNTKANILDISAESGVSGSVFNAREVTVDIVGLLTRHDADKFKRFRANDETRFCFNFGSKSGGNWEAGKCASLYIPTCTISSFQMGDADGLVTLEMTLTAFVDTSGNGEVYLNFL